MTTTVPRRRLGAAGPEASVLSLGSWHTYDRMDFADAVAMVRHAVDSGINLFDVAVYGMPGVHPPVFTDVLFSAIVRAAGIAKLAAELDATPAQLCIAFPLTHPSTATVLFGASRMERLTDNSAALEVLDRVGPSRLRALMAPFWVDRDVVDPEGP